MKRSIIGAFVVLMAGVALQGQQAYRCVETVGSGGAFSLACAPETVTPPPPVVTAPTITSLTADPSQIAAGASSALRWTLGGGAPVSLSLNQGIGGVPASTRSRTVTPTATTSYTLTATNTAGTVTRSVTVTVNVPPPPASNIWPAREVDPEVLGQCSADVHDRTLVDGGDGFRYYTWHAQLDPSGCVYKHEHGHDPGPATSAMVAHLKANTYGFSAAKVAELVAAVQRPWLFGYAAKRMPMPGEPMGHAEPHAGFKWFYALHREQNDEGRYSEMIAGHVAHMGTGGVGRYRMPHHSVESRQFHVPSGSYQITNRMFNFGGADMVCAPRQNPTRDFITILTSRCGIDSPYEIWSGHAEVWQGGTMLARFFSTPAAFDPITVRNASNDAELVYAWDPRVLVTRNHDGDSWAGFRGCNREAYAQPGIYEAAGHYSVWVDIPSGQVVPAGAVNAVQQWFYSPIATFDHRGSTPVNGEAKGNQAFKMPRPNCGMSALLGLKN